MAGSILAAHAAALGSTAADLQALVARVQAVADGVLGVIPGGAANQTAAPTMGASSGLGAPVPTLQASGSLGAIQQASQKINLLHDILEQLVGRLEQL